MLYYICEKEFVSEKGGCKMIEYKGKTSEGFSKMFDENVAILKYKIKSSIPYCSCDRCGKPIKSTMYVAQSKETDVELGYFGSECIKYVI